MQTIVKSPVYEADGQNAVPYLKAATVWNPDHSELVLFLLNRNLDQALEVTVEPRMFGRVTVTDWTVLHETDLKATNSGSSRERVKPKQGEGAAVKDGKVTLELPAASWSMLRLALQ